MLESGVVWLNLDAVDMTVSCGSHTERVSEDEFLLLEQMIRFAEQPLRRESLMSSLTSVESWAPDRVLNQSMQQLIRKVNVLHPPFPLLRRLSKDAWVYTQIAPKKKR